MQRILAFSVSVFLGLSVWQTQQGNVEAASLTCKSEDWAFLVGRSHSALGGVSLPRGARIHYKTPKGQPRTKDHLQILIGEDNQIAEVRCV